MVDVVIVHPGEQRGTYGPLADEFTAVEPPTWTRMIAGWLRDRGVDAAMIDQEAERAAPDEVAAAALAKQPKLVVVAVYGHQPSASTQNMPSAGRLVAAVKTLDPGRKVMLVGNHCSALPERTLAEEAADYVCDGEGPLTILGLLNGDDERKIPGLVWRGGRNAPAPLLPIDELHGDVWADLPMRAYRAHSWQCFGDLVAREPYASIYTTLGCPHACSFCMINTFQHSNTYRMRSPERVVDEIEYLHEEYGVSTIKIADEMFVLAPRHYVAVCKQLAERGLGRKLNIWAYSRVDTVAPHNLALLRAAGIRWLALGIESASKHVRDGASKKLKTEDIVGVVRKIQSHGINVIGNFMFGLRDDDHSTMQQTLDLAFECMPDFANFYSCMSYPGSALYDEAVAKGWKLPATWNGYSQHNEDCRPLDTEHVSGEEVLAFRDQAFARFFADDRYRAHVANKFGADTLAHVERMARHKLRRKLLEATA